MERRNELKAKARELEHGNRPEEALALYVQLLDRAEQPSPAMWARAGELQLRLGQSDSAGRSLGNAIDGFAAAGQLNNAIAMAYRLAETHIGEPDVHLRLGKLALEKGYRRIARDSIAAFARVAASAGSADQAIEPIAAFLRRFPDEQELWRDWVEELLGMGREAEALDGLRRLSDLLAGGGAEAAVTAIRAEIARLRRPERGAADAPDLAPATEAPTRDDMGEGDLPLLGNLPESAAPRADEAARIAPLAGLQTTHGDWDLPDSSEEVDAEPLPLLGTAPEIDQDDLQGMSADPGIMGSRDFAESRPPTDEDDRAEVPLPEQEPLSETGMLDADAGAHSPHDLPVAPMGAAGPVFDARAAVAELTRLITREVEPAEEPSTHYDLGVAFKEMGLVDESIAHLTAALDRGHDAIATLEVLGEILVSRGRYELAGTLLGGLAGGSADLAELLGIHYWLARSAEELGKGEDARRQYQQILAIDSSFRDASVRLGRLSNPF